jgi:hypothetical protein
MRPCRTATQSAGKYAPLPNSHAKRGQIRALPDSHAKHGQIRVPARQPRKARAKTTAYKTATKNVTVRKLPAMKEKQRLIIQRHKNR